MYHVISISSVAAGVMWRAIWRDLLDWSGTPPPDNTQSCLYPAWGLPASLFYRPIHLHSKLSLKMINSCTSSFPHPVPLQVGQTPLVSWSQEDCLRWCPVWQVLMWGFQIDSLAVDMAWQIPVRGSNSNPRADERDLRRRKNLNEQKSTLAAALFWFSKKIVS